MITNLGHPDNQETRVRMNEPRLEKDNSGQSSENS